MKNAVALAITVALVGCGGESQQAQDIDTVTTTLDKTGLFFDYDSSAYLWISSDPQANFAIYMRDSFENTGYFASFDEVVEAQTSMTGVGLHRWWYGENTPEQYYDSEKSVVFDFDVNSNDVSVIDTVDQDSWIYTFEHLSGMEFSIEEMQGVTVDSEYAESITVNSDGSFTARYTNEDCVLNGQLTPIESGYNVVMTTESCFAYITDEDYNGTYEGIGFTVDTNRGQRLDLYNSGPVGRVYDSFYFNLDSTRSITVSDALPYENSTHQVLSN